jgi:hypothetical protein
VVDAANDDRGHVTVTEPRSVLVHEERKAAPSVAFERLVEHLIEEHGLAVGAGGGRRRKPLRESTALADRGVPEIGEDFLLGLGGVDVPRAIKEDLAHEILNGRLPFLERQRQLVDGRQLVDLRHAHASAGG